MNKTLNLIVGIFAIINVFYSFWNKLETGRILGFEMNIWLYRAIWALMGIYLISSYMKSKKIDTPSS